MVVLSASAAAPFVVNSVWTTAGLIRAGYWEDVVGAEFADVVTCGPPALLAVLAVWASRLERGKPVVTVSCLLLVLISVFGFTAAFTSERSMAGLVFIPVLAVQWSIALGCGVSFLVSRSLDERPGDAAQRSMASTARCRADIVLRLDSADGRFTVSDRCHTSGP